MSKKEIEYKLKNALNEYFDSILIVDKNTREEPFIDLGDKIISGNRIQNSLDYCIKKLKTESKNYWVKKDNAQRVFSDYSSNKEGNKTTLVNNFFYEYLRKKEKNYKNGRMEQFDMVDDMKDVLNRGPREF